MEEKKQSHRMFRSVRNILVGSFAVSLALLFIAYAQISGMEGDRADRISTLDCFHDMSVQDFDGNTVDESIFSGYKLTLINTWETTCNPCVGEMPDLQKISETYQDKGIQIIGMCADVITDEGVVDDSMMQDADELLQSTGAQYLQIIPSKDIIDAYLDPIVTAYPTTVLVDETGKVLDVTLGSRNLAEWEAYIDEKLAE